MHYCIEHMGIVTASSGQVLVNIQRLSENLVLHRTPGVDTDTQAKVAYLLAGGCDFTKNALMP